MKIVRECYMTKGIINIPGKDKIILDARLQVDVICDKNGKTVSIANSILGIQFTIPAERLASLLK